MSKRVTWRVLLVILGIVSVGATTPARNSDADGDGIDDDLEAQLAAEFLPEIRYHGDEGCAGPGHWPILFRLRYASKYGVENPNYIVINYVRLYTEDCGSNAHPGDNEPFLVFLELVNGNWTFSSLSATAHTGTPVELRTASGNPTLWVSKNKHGGFAELSECGSIIDVCESVGDTGSHALYNVGEPSTWLLSNLGDVFSSWNGHYVWNGLNFLDAGVISDNLFTTDFIHLTPVPGYAACYSACQAAAKQCLAQNSFEYCQGEQAYCNHSCDMDHLRWDP